MKFGLHAGKNPFADVKRLITWEASSEGDAGNDRFSKVKELMTDLITDLSNRLQPENSHLPCCNDEFVKASVNKEDFETHVEMYSFKRETAVSKSKCMDGDVEFEATQEKLQQHEHDVARGSVASWQTAAAQKQTSRRARRESREEKRKDETGGESEGRRSEEDMRREDGSGEE